MSALHYRSLTEVAAMIRRGECSAESVTAAMLERIDLQSGLQAYSQVLAERALQQARERDRALAEGRPAGPLHGVPVAVKDLLDVAGFPTTVGTTVMADRVAAASATVVRRLEAAGAVLLGKTRLTEGAFSEHHPDLPTPQNPWNPELWTGVSSSGSAVATASGQAFGSLGTDTGGSIRFPSAACGLVGVKPSYGRVSRQGAFALAESLDHIGPMTRTVADAARMLGVLAGADSQDPTSLRASVPNFEASLQQGVAGLVIGLDPDWVRDGVEPQVTRAVMHAADLLQQRGAEVRELTAPAAQPLIDGWVVTCGVEAALAHVQYFPAQRDVYGPVLTGLLDLGSRVDGQGYAQLERERERYRAALDACFEQIDAMLVPAMPFLPPAVTSMAAMSQDQSAAAPVTFTAPFNYSGHPSVTQSIGLSDRNQPLAVQLVGARLDEARLLRIAAALEAEAGFTSCFPD